MGEIDNGSILDEGLIVCRQAVDLSGNFLHLTKSERRRAKVRERARREKWRVASAARANWTAADFIAEEERLRAEIEAWDSRNAA